MSFGRTTWLAHETADDMVVVYLRTPFRCPVESTTVDYAGHNWVSNVDAEEVIVEVPWGSMSQAPRETDAVD